MKVNFKLIGQKQIEKRLRQISETSTDNLQGALTVAAFKVEADAKVIITEKKAVDTGRLRASINSKVLTGLAIVGVPISVGYGKFIEYGTSRMSARPFLYPAFQKNLRFIKNILKKAVQKAIK